MKAPSHHEKAYHHCVSRIVYLRALLDRGTDESYVGAMKRSKQQGTRLLYSNDGKAYVTPDHYESIIPLGNWK